MVSPNNDQMREITFKFSQPNLDSSVLNTSQSSHVGVMTKQQREIMQHTYKLQINENGEYNLVFDPKQYVDKKLKEEDVINLKQLFDLFDSDGSQTLSPSDLKDMLAGFEYYCNKNTIYQMISNFDGTESGSLTFDDFIRIFKKEPETRTRWVKEIFREYSKTEKNYIVFEDLKRINKDLAEDCDDQALRAMIAKFDSDNDGKLSFSDFQKAMLLQ